MAYIYVITNDINGKQYVGKTNFSIEKRFKEHLNEYRKERCEKRPLYNAINKYGEEHFSIKQLEECSAEEASIREEYWIKELNTYGSNGYNATRGGDSKHYYDYEEIVKKYQELQNQKDTAKFFNYDVLVVRTACRELGVHILSTQEIAQREKGKRVLLIEENIEFPSIRDAARYLVEKGYTTNKSLNGIAQHIRENCRGQYKHAYNLHWEYVD